MSHVNKVYDSDPHFTINPITRQIVNDSSKKTTLIQNDHNSERFSFSISRLIEGHDMSECNRVEVHYNNSGFEDVYEVEDLQINPEDEEKIVFSWLLSGNATRNIGKLEFAIHFACVVDDGTVDYAWNTAIHGGINISKGMNNSQAVVEENPDILTQWKTELFEDLNQKADKSDVSLLFEESTQHYRNYDELNRKMGDVETALDGIIAIQNGILGVSE